MAETLLRLALRNLRRLMAVQAGGDQSDGQLLERFLAAKDETAFEGLLERHGPLVWGVCRRVLRDETDAEDAFQATFLILVRRGQSIVRRESVGSWLYGVALRTAMRARAAAARRRILEQRTARSTNAPSEGDSLGCDVRPILDEELEQLPRKYRDPIVLCYLEGKTNEEAARLLGWTKGTVSGRLARARDLLRGRLTRRGVTLTAATLVELMAQEASAAPAALRALTVKAALHVATAATSLGVSTSVVALMEGVLKMMWWQQVKIVAIVSLCLGVVGGTGFVGYATLTPAAAVMPMTPPFVGQAPAPQSTKPAEGAANEAWRHLVPFGPRVTDPELVKLAEAMYQTAQEEWAGRWLEFSSGRADLSCLCGSSRHILQAKLTLASTKAEAVAALEGHWRQMREAEDLAKLKLDNGRIAIQDFDQVKFDRLQAELWLESVKKAK